MSAEPSPHLKPWNIWLQEDSVVNSKQDLELGCLSPHKPDSPSPSVVSCLTQILGELWEMEGAAETEVRCNQIQVLPKQPHSASALDDILENAKPLPARAEVLPVT